VSRDSRPPAERIPVLHRLSDIDPQEVDWLWYPYLPLGKFALLEGDPGIGKTHVALALSAIITRGLPWPEQGQAGPRMTFTNPREPGNVLYLSAEDGLGDTLRPRLGAANADIERVIAMTGWTATVEGQEVSGLVTLDDKRLLDQTLTIVQPTLVIIDPLQAYLGADVDAHRANEVRPRLRNLTDLAEKHKCSILAIRHLGKSGKGKAIYSGLGSIDFAAAARSILLAGEHKGQTLIAHVKSSLAPRGNSIRYEIQEGTVIWAGSSDVTADQMVSDLPGPDDNARAEARDFIGNLLGSGPMKSKDVQVHAKDAGVAKRTLERAFKEDLRGACRPLSRDGKLTWYWLLPGQSLKDLANLADLEENTVSHTKNKLRQDGELWRT
jgi:putative DNA primase/helicase